MVLIDASNLTDDALKSYDTMMVEAVIKISQFSGLAVNIWSEVLRELDVRNLVTLVSGSYDDIGNSLVTRHW
jgi:hypothetical protein